MTGTEFSDFNVSQQMIAAAIMLLGRVEVLTVFAALSGVTMRRG
jgi:Trk-type K+ transport system membrane component